MVCLSVILLLQNSMLMIFNKSFYNKKGVLFVSDPVFGQHYAGYLCEGILG